MKTLSDLPTPNRSRLREKFFCLRPRVCLARKTNVGATELQSERGHLPWKAPPPQRCRVLTGECPEHAASRVSGKDSVSDGKIQSPDVAKFEVHCGRIRLL